MISKFTLSFICYYVNDSELRTTVMTFMEHILQNTYESVIGYELPIT